MLPSNLNTKETRDNIRNLFDAAHNTELEHGLTWYYDANEIAQDIAERLSFDNDVNVDVAAAVIAVLSPMNDWETNVKDAFWIAQNHERFETDGNTYDTRQNWRQAVGATVMETAKQDGYMVGQAFTENWYKALMILKTGQIAEFVRGPKVSRFYRNIRYPNKSLEITVDRHAVNALLGRTTSDRERGSLQGTRYQTAVDAYLTVAEELGLKPWQLQAVVWVVQKNRHGFQINLPF